MNNNNIDRLKATGRTTRLADEYIQELFNNVGEWIPIEDHYGYWQSNKRLHDIIANRLYAEHKIRPDSKTVIFTGFLRLPELRIPKNHND